MHIRNFQYDVGNYLLLFNYAGSYVVCLFDAGLCVLYVLGAFLIPYVISVCLLGTPVYFLEASLGQFTSQGAIRCWQIAPLFQGIKTFLAMLKTT